jgi:hypothetical protein
VTPTLAGVFLEEYAARLERGGHELWHGEAISARKDAVAFRALATQIRQMERGARFHSRNIVLLERHAAQLRRINEPLMRREVAEPTRQEAILAVGSAAQLEQISSWISRMTGEW